MADYKVRRVYIFSIIAVLLIILFHYLGWFLFLEKGVRSIFVPLLSKTHDWGANILKNKEINSVVKNFGGNEYEQWQTTLKEKSVLETKLKVLALENEELKETLNFINKKTFSYISAQVIGNSTDNIERTLIITAGYDEGIKIGQPVISSAGILVGKISKVEDDISIVRLLNDNSSKIAAELLNKDKSEGVVEGGYGLSVGMNFIPRNEKVMVGDTVITSGLEQNIPRGLLIGTVAAVQNEAYQPFQQAILVPAENLSKIMNVTVLKTN